MGSLILNFVISLIKRVILDYIDLLSIEAPLYLATSPSFGPSATKEGEEEGKGPVTTPSSPLTPQHDLNSTELGLSDVREEEEPATAATTTQETVEDETTTKTDSPKRKKSRSVSRENHSISGDENVNALSDKESREMRTRASPPPKLPSPRRVGFNGFFIKLTAYTHL